MNPIITKVLLVDDDPAMNYVNDFFIKHYKYCDQVVVEQYPDDALEKMKIWAKTPSELPNLILLDLNMPVMSGYQLAQAFADHIPSDLLSNIRVFILSSSDIAREIDQAMKLPFVKGYLPKPLTIEDLDKIFKGA